MLRLCCLLILISRLSLPGIQGRTETLPGCCLRRIGLLDRLLRGTGSLSGLLFLLLLGCLLIRLMILAGISRLRRDKGPLITRPAHLLAL